MEWYLVLVLHFLDLGKAFGRCLVAKDCRKYRRIFTCAAMCMCLVICSVQFCWLMTSLPSYHVPCEPAFICIKTVCVLMTSSCFKWINFQLLTASLQQDDRCKLAVIKTQLCFRRTRLDFLPSSELWTGFLKFVAYSGGKFALCKIPEHGEVKPICIVTLLQNWFF